MSRWNACRALLDTHLLALAGIDPLCIAWPNRTFTKPTGKIWYSIAFLPSDVESAMGPGASTHEKGTYQVAVFAPANASQGMVPLIQEVDRISSHFDRVTLGSTVRLQCSVPVPGPMLTETDWVQIPVSIRFIAL